jgi:hypothetical protein
VLAAVGGGAGFAPEGDGESEDAREEGERYYEPESIAPVEAESRVGCAPLQPKVCAYVENEEADEAAE